MKKQQRDKSFRLHDRLLWYVLVAMMAVTTLAISINTIDSNLYKPISLQFVGLALLAILFAKILFDEEIPIGASPFNGFIILYVLFAGCTACFSAFSYQSVPEFLKLLSCTIAFFAVAYFLDRRKIQKFVLAIVVITAIACLYAVLDVYLLSLFITKFTAKERSIISTFGNTGYFAGFLITVLPIILSQIPRKGISRIYRVFLSALAIGILILIILSKTRSTWIAVLFLFGWILFYYRRFLFQKRWLTLAILAGVAIVVFSFRQIFLERIATIFEFTSESSIARRTFFWQAAFNGFLDSPVIGQGFGTYSIVMPRFRSPDYWMVQSEDIVPHTHNEFLEILSDTGLIGFGLFLAIIILYFIRVRRIYHLVQHDEKLLALGCAMGIASCLVDNLANLNLRTVPVMLLFWIILGLTVLLTPQKQLHVRTVSLRNSRRFAFVPYVVLAALVPFFFSYQANIITADGLMFHGSVSEMGQQKPQALKAYSDALQYDSTRTFALFRSAVLDFETGQFQNALLKLQILERLSPFYPKLHLVRGLCFARLVKYAEAVIEFTKELQLSSHPQNFLLLANTYRGLEQSDKEQETLERMLTVSIRGKEQGYAAASASRLSQIYSDSTNWQNAVPQIRAAANQFPNETSILSLLAKAYHHIGNVDSAIAFYQQVLALSSTDSLARHNLDELQTKRQ
jgi:O-antigen ligase/tetratricopeptide (TPR) repeat protein